MKNAKGRKAGERRQILAGIERRHLQKLLQTIETWWPVYASKNPKADRGRVTRRIASRLADLPIDRFSRSLPISKSGTRGAAHPIFDAPDSAAALVAGPEVAFGHTSGMLLASAFKWYDVETKERSDTQDFHDVAPVGAEGWSGASGARFWQGFTRTDSTLDQIEVWNGSPSDRVVHLAVLRLTPPTPRHGVRAMFRTALALRLPHGAELINDWGWFDDTDSASMQIDFCSAFTLDGGGVFPSPQEFSYDSVVRYTGSNGDSQFVARNVVHTVDIPGGVRPDIYLGVRITCQGADCRIQTGFTQHALDAQFSLRVRRGLFQSDPGLFYSYGAENLLATD